MSGNRQAIPIWEAQLEAQVCTALTGQEIPERLCGILPESASSWHARNPSNFPELWTSCSLCQQCKLLIVIHLSVSKRDIVPTLDLLPGNASRCEIVLSLATVTFPIFAFVAAEAHTVASGIASLNSWQGCAWDPAAITAENAGDHPLIFKLWVLRCLKCRQGLLNNLFSGQWQPPKVRVARPDCCWPPEPCLP